VCGDLSSCRFRGNGKVAGIKAVGIAVLTFAERNRHIRETHCADPARQLWNVSSSVISRYQCNVGRSCCVEVLDVRLNVEGRAVYSLKWRSLYYTALLAVERTHVAVSPAVLYSVCIVQHCSP